MAGNLRVIGLRVTLRGVRFHIDQPMSSLLAAYAPASVLPQRLNALHELREPRRLLLDLTEAHPHLRDNEGLRGFAPLDPAGRVWAPLGPSCK